VGKRRQKANPIVYHHPDLFVGESPVRVAIDDLTIEQLRELPRFAYTNEEWDELDYDLREDIYQADSESRSRVEQLAEGIQSWLAGDFVTSLRSRLRVRFLGEGGTVHEWLALNDVVVGREDIGRMVDVNVDIDGRRAVSYSGDGLILATPTGSTAHALAAGGPLLDPTVDALVMVPIAPHSLATRPIVLTGSHRIELSARGSRAPARVTVDGAPPVPLGDGDRIEVVDARAPLTLIRVFGGPFYEALRTKLGWRGRPVYMQEPGEEVADGPEGLVP
jgi:hypothetical protein